MASPPKVDWESVKKIGGVVAGLAAVLTGLLLRPDQIPAAAGWAEWISSGLLVAGGACGAFAVALRSRK